MRCESAHTLFYSTNSAIQRFVAIISYTWKSILLKITLNSKLKGERKPEDHFAQVFHKFWREQKYNLVHQMRIEKSHVAMLWSSLRPLSKCRNTYVYRSITRDNFWIRFNRKSPCLIVAWYREFLASGRLVSRTPETLSILQWSFPAAMKRDSSLQIHRMG